MHLGKCCERFVRGLVGTARHFAVPRACVAAQLAFFDRVLSHNAYMVVTGTAELICVFILDLVFDSYLSMGAKI